MQEEFHGDSNGYKQLYGWNTLNANVWLPSLSELVGTIGNQDATHGCYKSAMQGLNLSSWYDTDSKGGPQWAYFIQFNASGGGEKIWDCIGKEPFWTRSPVYAYADRVTSFSNSGGVGHTSVTSTFAVHPAVSGQTGQKKKEALCLLLLCFCSVSGENLVSECL